MASAPDLAPPPHLEPPPADLARAWSVAHFPGRLVYPPPLALPGPPQVSRLVLPWENVTGSPQRVSAIASGSVDFTLGAEPLFPPLDLGDHAEATIGVSYTPGSKGLHAG